MTGSHEGGSFFIETVTYPDGTSYKVFMSSYFGRRLYKGRECECFSAYLDDNEVFIYRHQGLWIADTEAPDWYK